MWVTGTPAPSSSWWTSMANITSWKSIHVSRWVSVPLVSHSRIYINVWEAHRGQTPQVEEVIKCKTLPRWIAGTRVDDGDKYWVLSFCFPMKNESVGLSRWLQLLLLSQILCFLYHCWYDCYITLLCYENHDIRCFGHCYRNHTINAIRLHH